MQNGAMAAPPQSDSVLLPGGARMPLIGFGTYKVDKADSVRWVLHTLARISNDC